MFEKFDWVKIGAWSTAAVLTGAAIYGYWKTRRAITDSERVRNGETVNGWRLLIPKSHQTPGWIVGPCSLELPNNDYVGAIGRGELTILQWFDGASSDDQQSVFSINRQSLVLPEACKPICRIAYKENDWALKDTWYVSSRIIAVMFKHRTLQLCCLVLFNTIAKSHRSVAVEMPDAGENQTMYFMHPIAVHPGDATRSRINVEFFACSYDGDGQSWYYDFYDCSYELPTSHQMTQIKPTSWESLSIPVGHRPTYSKLVRCLGAVLLYNREHLDDIDGHQVVWLNRRNVWRMDNVRNWFNKLRSTVPGMKLLNAVDSFCDIVTYPDCPPCDLCRFLVPLYYLQSISLFNFDGAVLMSTGSGICQRQVYPPSLKRIAAEAFCRANPNMDFARLKNEIGFDIFDGIFDAKDGDAPLIYL